MAGQYDVIIIGSGPGGYVSAIRCSQLGLKTLCIEKCGDEGKPILGGTCLNVGCIPSKALLDSSSKLIEKEKLSSHGIDAGEMSVDIATMQSRKQAVVKSLTQGVEGLFKLNKVDFLNGKAFIKTKNEIIVETLEGSKNSYTTKNIIVATGSSPIELNNIGDERKNIITSKEALELEEVPANMAIIGAGAIGLEIGSIWNRLGSNVVLLEAMNEFLPQADNQISKQSLRVLKKQGLDIKLDANVLNAEPFNNKVKVIYSCNSVEHELIVDKLITAVGRKPFTDSLFSKDLNLEINSEGCVVVNELCCTSIPNIYAIGDVTGGQMLAHKASEEAVMVSENIHKQASSEVDYNLIPSVIYTHPEIAWVGLSEKDAIQKGFDLSTGSFPFSINGRALASGDTEGFVKTIVDNTNDKIIGVHILGSNASELLQQAVVAMRMNSSAEDLSRTIFSHPSLSEALHESILSAKGKAIHLNNRKKK